MKVLLCLVLALIPAVALAQRESCTHGKVYSDCGSGCPPTCDNPQPLCFAVCAMGCFCPPGMVENSTGGCVHPSNCPGRVTTTAPTPVTPPSCTNGRIFNQCGTACPLTCEHPDPRPCVRICVQGCFCPRGLLQYNGGCVTREECPSAATTISTSPPPTKPPPPTTAPSTTPLTIRPPQSCTHGKVYSDCGSGCPPTCDNPQPLCFAVCAMGCFCPPGTVENSTGGCVLPSNCPGAAATTPPPTRPPPTAPPTTPLTTRPPRPVCTHGQIYETCGSACPLTCQNRNDPPRPCPFICVQGCFCPHGMAEYEGRCYRPEECPATVNTTYPTTAPTPVTTPPPPQCTNGQVYQTCGTACPLTCENRFNRPLFCTLNCVQGCFCPFGMAEHNGHCYPPDSCPSTVSTTQPTTTSTPLTLPPPPQCTNGRVYETCGTACPLTCANRNDPPRPCPLICVQGCFCPRGMAEDGGHCYQPESCPGPEVTTTTPPVITTLPPPTTPSTTCPNNMIYQSCGTACPLTCENRHNPPLFCTFQCRIGCACPRGMAEYNNRCYRPDECPSGNVTITTAPPTSPPTRPPPPVCTGGMTYQTCATACLLTCANRNSGPLFCPAVCRIGCACPPGMAEHNGVCYAPDQCPGTGVNTTFPTARPTTPSTPTCANNMIYETCGTACPITCANRNNPPAVCPAICVQGCFCPRGMVEDGNRCVQPANCPITTPATTTSIATLPTPPACPASMVFTSCGSACHLTCDNYMNAPLPCTRQCFIGCVCPINTVLHNGECISPRSCPPPTTTTAMTVGTPPPCPRGKEYRDCGPLCRPTCGGLNGCFSLRCAAGCFCPEGQYEFRGRCVEQCPSTNPCELNNGGCRDDQVCEVVSDYPRCRDPPYVPCGRDAFLACDSEWTYCLQQNKTRRASCVASCLSRNGNCARDTTCVTTINEDRDTPTLHCLDSDDLPKDCPAGQVMNQCGNLCQETCEQRVTGLARPCPRVCGPPACTCPAGLVLFRDRCVDPRLCYTLLKYPPAIQPLPVVSPNAVMLSLRSNSLDQSLFMTDEHRQSFLQSIESALGFDDVEAQLHGFFNDSQGIHIVVMLSGDDIDSSSASSLATILSQNSQRLTITIEQVVPVDIEYVPDGEEREDSDTLSRTAIIAIAVSSGVAGLAVVVAWVAVVLCCCVMRERKGRRSPPPAYQTEKTENMIPLDQKVLIMDPEKGKLLLESLKN